MSFVIGLCAVLGLVAGGLTYLLFRRRAWIPLAASILEQIAVDGIAMGDPIDRVNLLYFII